MKYLLLSLACVILFVSCGQCGSTTKIVENTSSDTREHSVRVNDYRTIEYYIVTIEGKDYIATRTYNGYYTLCPKQ